MEFLEQFLGKRIGDGLEFFEEKSDEITKVFRCETEGFWIDGNETGGMGGIAGHAFEGGAGNDEAMTVFCHFAGDADFHALSEDLSDEFLVEPDKTNRTGVIGESGIREEYTLLETSLDGKCGESTGEGRLHSRGGFGEGKGLRIIFVATGEMEEEIGNRGDAEMGEFVVLLRFDDRKFGEGSVESHKGNDMVQGV